jgi:hypothetical protein
MKHLLLALCLAAGVADGEPGQAAAAQDRVTVRGTWRADPDNYWTRNNNERWVSLQLRYDDNNSGIGIPEREVPALGDRRSDGPIHFTLSRDAGRFDFTGEVSNGRGRGDFTFAPSADFVSGMQQLGYARVSDEDVWRFAMHDVTRTYVSDFKKAGYQLDTSELIKSRIHDATPAFAEQVKQEGFGRQEIDELVKMRIHGVTPEFIKSWSDLGYKNLSIEDLVKMRIHGVTPEFVHELSDLGYKNLSIDDLVKMRIHGVTPDYIRKMKELGYPNIKVDRLVQFRIHGVDEDLIRSAKAHGFNDLSADDLVDLAIHGRRWLKS